MSTTHNKNAQWFSYHHQKATAPAPRGTSVLYPWLNGSEPVVYQVSSYDDADKPVRATLRPVGNNTLIHDVMLQSLVPIDNFEPIVIETMKTNATCLPLIRVSDGKPFIPMYYKQALNNQSDLVLLTPSHVRDTELVTVPAHKMRKCLFDTLFVSGLSDEALINSECHQQRILIALHDLRIKEKVARDQQVAAEWIASMK